VLERGRVGEVYNIGGGAERKNIDVVRNVCAMLDDLRPRTSGKHESLIAFVKDRPGHDRRYAMDASKIVRELDWTPTERFDTGLRKTIEWYLAHGDSVKHVTSGEYRSWIEQHYGGAHTA
jgi:dTDP-glucose 4,6-dehydratase